MTLVTSGQLSIGGTATDRSINLELSLAQNANSSLNQTNFRTLANVSSGTISIQDFYGKSAGGGSTCQAQTFYFSEDEDPDEYCEIGQTNVTRYMNATSTQNATELYSNSTCTTCAPSGWYYDQNGYYGEHVNSKGSCTFSPEECP
jgi:hypothetical protein|tara:strand:- start:8150 stop:8587 length:438 start_codon:yes stop_codon:yes gene_type:complete